MQYWLRKCTSEYNRKIGSTAPGYSYYVQGLQTQNDVFEVLTHFQRIQMFRALELIIPAMQI